MTTWHHYPLSHPWMPSLKRKLSDSTDRDSTSPSSSDHDSSSTTSQSYPSRTLPHPKRRRYDLARNLSRLSIFEQAQAQAHVQEPPLFQRNSLPPRLPDQDIRISSWSPAPLESVTTQASMDADGDIPILDVVRPVVEEPIDQPPAIPEVRMRNTSSYELEKDRIVVTDLDSSEDEADTPPQASTPDDTFSVSPALLSRIKDPKLSTPLVKPVAESDPTRALVVFKPSPWSAKDARELERIYRTRDAEKRSFDPIVTEVEEPDSDAMEIE